MANYKTYTNGVYEPRKWHSVGINPSLIKQLDAAAIAESEKKGISISRADPLEEAIGLFLKRYILSD
jgi:hypothetical protein